MMSPAHAKRAGFVKELTGLAPTGWIDLLVQPGADLGANPQVYVLTGVKHWARLNELRLMAVGPK